MRYIIKCEDTFDILIGWKAINCLIKQGTKDIVLEFEDDSVWYVKKTKTGYSARTAKNVGV